MQGDDSAPVRRRGWAVAAVAVALVVAAATCHFLAVWPLVTKPLGAA